MQGYIRLSAMKTVLLSIDRIGDRYRARIVAKGQDFTETYSPVMRMQTFRLLIALAQTRKPKISHFDAVSAFLNGKLTEEMEILEGVDVHLLPTKN